VIADAGGGYDTALDLEIEMFAGFDQYAYLREQPSLAQMTARVETAGAPFMPGASGRVNQADEGTILAKALRAWDVHEAVILHPALVEPLATGLTPKSGEVRWARKVIDAYETLVQEGENVAEIDGKIVDIYEYRRALKILQWAEVCAAKDRYKMKAVAKAQSEME
jgi:citrate lyase beta subunit